MLLVTVLLSACVAPTQAPAAGTEGTQGEAAAPAGAALRVIVPPGGTQRAISGGLETVQEDTGVAVNLEDLPIPEVRQQQVLDLSSGAGNLDIITNLNQWVGELNPHLVPLNSRMEESGVTVDQFIPGIVDLFTTDGQIYSLPVRVGGRVLVYRQDLLAEAGYDSPPTTYEELADLARELTTGDQYGFIINLGQDAHMLDSWSSVFLGFGGQFLNEDGTAGFNSQAGVDALQWVIDLYNEGVIPPDAIEMDDGGMQAAMQQGRGAMAIIFSGWYAPMVNPEASDLGEQIAVAPLPASAASGLEQGPSLLSVWAWGINSASDNQDAAWEVIRYITSPEIQKKMAVNFGNGPSVAEVYNDPDFIAANPAAPDILAALSGGQSQPPLENWAAIAEILTEELTRAIIGDATPQEALDSAAERANAELGR